MYILAGVLSTFLMGLCSGQVGGDPLDVATDSSAVEATVQCGQDKYCVVRYLCINGTISRYGSNLISPRLSDFQECETYQECCYLTPTQKQTQTQTQTPTKTQTPMSMPLQMPMQTQTEPDPTCGQQNPNGIAEVARSKPYEVEFGEFPWILKLSDVRLEKFYGGASLIHSQIALTAAHCVNNLQTTDISVVAGVWNINNVNEMLPRQTRNVSEKVQHPRFNNANLRYDIALLFLSQPFNLEPHIGTVCLSPPQIELTFTTCFGTGWGLQARNTKKYSVYPKKISLDIEDHATCQTALRQTNLTNYFKLHKTFLCAGGERNIDTCRGDGGSPLFCPVTGKSGIYFQAGIVSWGMGCGEEDVPGVYTNLPLLRPWVDEQVTQRKLETSPYTY